MGKVNLKVQLGTVASFEAYPTYRATHSLTATKGYQLVNNAQETLYPSAEPYSTEKIPDFSTPQQPTTIYNECNLQENVPYQHQMHAATYHPLPTTAEVPMASQFTQPIPLFPALNQTYTQDCPERRLSDNSIAESSSLTGSMAPYASPHGLGGNSFSMLPQQLSNGTLSQTSTISSDTTVVELQVSHVETTSEWRTIPSSHSGYGLDMVILPGPRSGKRGPFKDVALREQTAQTRKIGSCVRCRMQRIRVSNFQLLNRGNTNGKRHTV